MQFYGVGTGGIKTIGSIGKVCLLRGGQKAKEKELSKKRIGGKTTRGSCSRLQKEGTKNRPGGYHKGMETKGQPFEGNKFSEEERTLKKSHLKKKKKK